MNYWIRYLAFLSVAILACRPDDLTEPGPSVDFAREGLQLQQSVDSVVFGAARDFGSRPPITWSRRNTELLADADRLIDAVRNAGGRAHIRFKDENRLRITSRLSVVSDDTLASQPPVSAMSIKAGRDLITRLGGDIYMPFRHLPSVVARIDPASVPALLASPVVEYVLPVDFFSLVGWRTSLTFNPVAGRQTTPANILKVRAPNAWDSTQGLGSNVLIFDTGVYGGFETTHRDLPLSTILDPFSCMNFVPGEIDCEDAINGHGTEVAGVAFAINNSIDVVGVAPQAGFGYVKVCLPIQGPNGCQTDAEVAALMWAAANGTKDVINMSFGGSINNPELADAVNFSHLAGIY